MQHNKLTDNPMPTIRPADTNDVDTILAMYDHSRGLMRADGNMEQWTGYPTRDDVLADLQREVSYVMLQENRAVGTFALVPGIEPTYAYIDHGRWIDTDTPYVTMHRLAKSAEGRGIARLAFRMAKEESNHLRVDTHASNRAMRHLLESDGFVECGVVYMDDGAPRVAFEWWRYDQVPASLKQYVEDKVLPQYDTFDAAHRRDHARRVIARAMNITRPTGVIQQSRPSLDVWITPKSGAMTYAAAAMHDLGLAEGREEHHLASGRIIRACRELRQWFSEEEVEQIAQAAEDHRASATLAPRSMLGCIIAEADRDVEPETIVRRTVEYGLSHHPTLDREGHWQRTLQHLNEKYAEGGYLKLWLSNSPNAAPLAELRALIHDHARLRPLFERFYSEGKNQ